MDHNLDKQAEFDREFTVGNLDAKEPPLSNRAIQGHRRLRDNEQGKQREYDKEALVREIDRREPDVGELKARDLERAEIARRRAINHNLNIHRDQDGI